MEVDIRTVVGALALVVLTVLGLYLLTDEPAVSCFLGVMTAAGAVAWVGSQRAPPGRRLAPRLIATGLLLNAAAAVAWTVIDALEIDTDVSIADPLRFASYVPLCLALWVLHGRTRPTGDRLDVDFLVDAATIVVVSLLFFWSLSFDAIVLDYTTTPLEAAVVGSYPIADALLLAVALRVLVNRTARAALGVPFVVGVGLWLAADIAVVHVPGDDTLRVLVGAAWMVAPLLMAQAAWRTVSEQVDAHSSSRGNWVVLMALAVLPLMVPPGLEIAADVRGDSRQPVQLVVGTVALIALALVRTAGLIRAEERARRELEAARDLADEASHAKSIFLANISHELRTPLTTVLATAELLEDTTLDDLQLKLLSRMQGSGARLKSLVEEVLDFSRIEAGQIELTPTPFDLHALATDTAQGYVPLATRAGLQFEWHLDPSAPRTVVGDSGRLFQILTNLLDNAFKFTTEGRVTLTIQAPATGNGVEFVVSDTGIGISEADQGSVFESFTQVDGSTTRHYGGAGLGLAICKELTSSMGGTLTLHSRLGEGTSFVLRLPFVPPVEIPGDPPTTHGDPGMLATAGPD